MTETPQIFSLLPALHRRRDAEPGAESALLALTRVLDGARADLAADIDRLYRDWFVETCDPHVLPLIGDLVGLAPFERRAFDLRAIVVDTIAFRSRNDSVAAIAERLSALTGCPTRLVRGSEPSQVRAEMWLDQPFTFFQATPRPASESGRPGFYHFDALGRDVRLIDGTRARAGLDVPSPLTRDSPSDVLTRAVSIHVGAGGGEPLPSEAVVAGDLQGWRVGVAVRAGVRAVVDPVLGRLALLDVRLPSAVAVGYTRAAAARSGGGPYERARRSAPPGAWLAHVHGAAQARAQPEDQPATFSTLRAALEAFAAVPGPGVIRILDSGRHDVEGVVVGSPPGACPPDPDARRRLIIEAMSGETPCLIGTVTFQGAEAGLRLTLEGLWLEGSVRLAGMVSASLSHCTVQPDAIWHAQKRQPPAAIVSSGARPTQVTLRRCLVGPLHLSDRDRLLVLDSVVDGGRDGRAIVGEPSGRVTRSSVIGTSEFRRLESDDAIFDGRVNATGQDTGECRTSYVPTGPFTPRRTRCAPDEASIRPLWSSLSWGASDYAWLSPETDTSILAGGRDGREMGAHFDLNRAERIALCNEGLVRYLPPGCSHQVTMIEL